MKITVLLLALSTLYATHVAAFTSLRKTALPKDQLFSTVQVDKDVAQHLSPSQVPKVGELKNENSLTPPASAANSHRKSPLKHLKRLKFLDEVGDYTGNLLQEVAGETVKRRMWTKLDFLHIHAISGTLFLGIGFPWTLYTVFKHFGADGIALAQSENLSSFFLNFMAMQGAVNAISGFPMIRFSSTKLIAEFFSNSSYQSLIWVWCQLWFSGDGYPSWLHGTPDVIIFIFSTFIFLDSNILNEKMNLHEKKKLGSLRAKGNQDKDKKISLSIPKTMEEVYLQITVFQVSFLNILQIGFLSGPCLGEVAWMNKVTELYPLQRVLLFDFSIAMAVGFSFALFAQSLHERKIITSDQYFKVIISLGNFYPIVIAVVDSVAFGDKVTMNPMDYWYIFQRF